MKTSWQALHRFLRLPVGFWTKLAPQPQTAGGVGALATRACSRILRWQASFLARSRSALQGKQNFFLPLGAPMPMPHASQRPFKRFTALTVKSAKEPLGRHPCPSDFTILTLIQLAPVGGGAARHQWGDAIAEVCLPVRAQTRRPDRLPQTPGPELDYAAWDSTTRRRPSALRASFARCSCSAVTPRIRWITFQCRSGMPFWRHA
jgi:hypothetical protein